MRRGKNYQYTKKKMNKAFFVQAHAEDLDVVRAAAKELGLSQSEFVRRTLKAASARVLAGERLTFLGN